MDGWMDGVCRLIWQSTDTFRSTGKLLVRLRREISASNGGFGSPLQEIIFPVYKKSAQMEWI